MTKKSLARQQRDREMKDARKEGNEQIKDNRVYDDIRDVYTNCAQTIIGYSKSFNELCVDEVIPYMTQDQEQKVKTLATGFKHDIDKFTTDLVKINQPFQGKTGGEPSLDKFIDTIGVVDQFSEFIGRAKGVLDPTFRAMASEVAVAVEKTKIDPNVVTDVEVKEV